MGARAPTAPTLKQPLHFTKAFKEFHDHSRAGIKFKGLFMTFIGVSVHGMLNINVRQLQKVVD